MSRMRHAIVARFGAKGPANVPQVATPIGVPCAQCSEPIVEGDCGPMVPAIVDETGETFDVPFHISCYAYVAGLLEESIFARGEADGDIAPVSRKEAEERVALRIAMRRAGVIH